MDQSSTERRRLLLVDDCAPQRELYELMLERDFDVVTASRGAEGLELAVRTRPDAILLDVLMPEMDGWETCTRIRCDAATADIPVILLTAADDVDLSQHAVAVGASALLRKPCPADELRRTIDDLLRHQGGDRDPARPR